MEKDLNVIIENRLSDLNNQRSEILANLKTVNESLEKIEDVKAKIDDRQYLLDTTPREILQSIQSIIPDAENNYIVELYSSLFNTKSAEDEVLNEDAIATEQEDKITSLDEIISEPEDSSTNLDYPNNFELPKEEPVISDVKYEEPITLESTDSTVPGVDEQFDLSDNNDANDFYEKLRYGTNEEA